MSNRLVLPVVFLVLALAGTGAFLYSGTTESAQPQPMLRQIMRPPLPVGEDGVKRRYTPKRNEPIHIKQLEIRVKRFAEQEQDPSVDSKVWVQQMMSDLGKLEQDLVRHMQRGDEKETARLMLAEAFLTTAYKIQEMPAPIDLTPEQLDMYEQGMDKRIERFRTRAKATLDGISEPSDTFVAKRDELMRRITDPTSFKDNGEPIIPPAPLEDQ